MPVAPEAGSNKSLVRWPPHGRANCVQLRRGSWAPAIFELRHAGSNAVRRHRGSARVAGTGRRACEYAAKAYDEGRSHELYINAATAARARFNGSDERKDQAKHAAASPVAAAGRHSLRRSARRVRDFELRPPDRKFRRSSCHFPSACAVSGSISLTARSRQAVPTEAKMRLRRSHCRRLRQLARESGSSPGRCEAAKYRP